MTTRYRLDLRAKDPLVAQLRAAPDLFEKVAYVMPGGYASAQAVASLRPGTGQDRGNLAGLPQWCTVSRAAERGHVTVTAEHDVTTGAAEGYQLSPYNLSDRVSDGDEGVVPRLPGRWTWSLDVSKEWGFSVDGRPDRQTARSVGFRLTPERGHAAGR